MLFHRAPFLWLLFATFVGYWWLLRTQRARNLLLLVASVVFYAHWNPWLVPLVAGTAIFDYRMALAIEDARDEVTRRRRLVAAVAVPLGLLVYFKYTNFLVAQAWLPLRMLATAGAPAGVRHRAAARHLVLHLRDDRVRGGRLPSAHSRRATRRSTTPCSSSSSPT